MLLNVLGNLNHVFFYVDENKYPRMFIVHVWNIFSGFLSQNSQYLEFFYQIGESPHKNHEHTCFFPFPKLGLKALYELFQ